MVTVPAGRKRKHGLSRPTERIKQIQYLVEWEPSHIERWVLDKYAIPAGYRPCPHRPPTACSRQDMWDHERTCEVCWKEKGVDLLPEEEECSDMGICDKCSKTYHYTCAGHPAGWRPHTHNPWYCPACLALPQDCSPPPDDLLEVHWERTWEPQEELAKNEGVRNLIQAWKRANHNQPAQRHSGNRADSHLDPATRQGTHPQASPSWVSTLGDPTTRKATFITASVFPQADTCPLQRHQQIQLREVDLWQPSSQRGPSPEQPPTPQRQQAACVYTPGGRCLAILAPSRLQTLWTLYHQAQAAGKHEGLTPQVQPFEAEVADLLLRHRPRPQTPPPHAGPLPQVAWDTIGAALLPPGSAPRDRSATPLTVRDAHTLYHSDHARDAVFNALPATYSTKWEGLSVIYPHPGDPALTDKAVRWAAYSSRLTNRPTATLVVVVVVTARRP